MSEVKVERVGKFSANGLHINGLMISDEYGSFRALEIMRGGRKITVQVTAIMAAISLCFDDPTTEVDNGRR